MRPMVAALMLRNLMPLAAGGLTEWQGAQPRGPEADPSRHRLQEDVACVDSGNCNHDELPSIQCFNSTRDVWSECRRTCGTCDAKENSRELNASIRQQVRGNLTENTTQQAYYFSTSPKTVYTVVVQVVPGQVGSLADSFIYLFKKDEKCATAEDAEDSAKRGDSAKPGDELKCTLIAENDDGGTDPHNPSKKKNFGSRISFVAEKGAEKGTDYWVVVASASHAAGQRHGYYTITVKQGGNGNTCDDGQLSLDEEGVDCGGECAQCSIPLIFLFDRNTSISQTDDNDDGIPDFNQDLEKAIETTFPGFSDITATMKPYAMRTDQGISVNVMVQAPGLLHLLSRAKVVDSLDNSQELKTELRKQLDATLISVKRGMLCSGVSTYTCSFGVCDLRPMSTSQCICEDGYNGGSCADKIAIQGGAVVKKDEQNLALVFTLAGLLVLAIGALWGVSRHYKNERRKYNQSVFEMLKAPDTFGEPQGFQMADFGSRESNMLPPAGTAGGGLKEGLLNEETTSGNYTPQNSFITGGF